MIKTARQLEGAQEALGHLYLALASLRRTIPSESPGEFAPLEDGTIQQIMGLRKQIGAYLGLEDAPVNYSTDNPPTFVIQNDEQLRGTNDALGDLYRAVDSLRHRILAINPRQYGLFAEGPLDEIRKLENEIDSYLGLTPRPSDFVAVAGETTAALREQPPADSKEHE